VIAVLIASFINIQLSIILLYLGLLFYAYQSILLGSAYMLIMDPIYFLLKRQGSDLLMISLFRDFSIILLLLFILIKKTQGHVHLFRKGNFKGELSLLFFIVIVLFGFSRSIYITEYIQSLREYLFPLFMIYFIIKLNSKYKFRILVFTLLIQMITICTLESYNALYPLNSIFTYHDIDVNEYLSQAKRSIFGYTNLRSRNSMFVGGVNFGAIALSGTAISAFIVSIGPYKLKIINRIFLFLLGYYLLYSAIHFLSYTSILAILIPFFAYISVNNIFLKFNITNIIIFVILPYLIIYFLILFPWILTFDKNLIEYGINLFILPAIERLPSSSLSVLFGNDLSVRGGGGYTSNIADLIVTRGWFSYMYYYGLIGLISSFSFVLFTSLKAMKLLKNRNPWIAFVCLIYFACLAEIHVAPFQVRPLTSILITCIPLIIIYNNPLNHKYYYRNKKISAKFI
jgi:hypothetical protein